MTENFVVYYKTKFNDYVYYDYETDTFNNGIIIPRHTNAYYLFASYISKSFDNMTNEEINDQMKVILKAYAGDMIEWSEALKSSKCLRSPVDYMKSVMLSGNASASGGQASSGKQFYRSHYEMVFTFYKMYCGPISKQYFDQANDEIISYIESKWFESCYNGGLTYLRKAQQVYMNVHGYDFKQFYPTLMSSKHFKIPTHEGKEEILSQLGPKLKFGLYRVKIIVNDGPENVNDWDDADYSPAHFRMVFKFSPDNVYTHIDLNFIRVYFPQVSIELIQDEKPNAITYSKFVTGYDIFGFWFARICELRKEQPTNPLIKHLSSKFWGHLIQFSTQQMSEEQLMANPDIAFGPDGKYEMVDEIYRSDGSVLYEIAEKSKIYKHQIRIKPFLIAQARCRTAEIALSDPNHCVRIQTDGVIFDRPLQSNIANSPYKTNFDGLVPEDKTTGSFYFHHVNLYHKLEHPDDQDYIDGVVNQFKSH